MLLQELWLRMLDWDESLPMQLQTSWEAFKGTLLQLPMRAYGACIYVRTNTAEGLKVSLLTAKSKAPLKKKTLPRLELCAAHLLADLYNRLRPLINFPVTKVLLWTGSEITMHWIKTHPSSFSVFVSNRVAASIWFARPPFLLDAEINWPVNQH